MDYAQLLAITLELLFGILVFGSFLVIAMWKGRYALVNVTLSIYLALVITTYFPYFTISESTSTTSGAWIKILFFVGVVFLGTLLFRRLIPGDDYEKTFTNFGKKLLLASSATFLVLALSYNSLSLTEYVSLDSPLYNIFNSQSLFFWWLLAPLIILFFI